MPRPPTSSSSTPYTSQPYSSRGGGGGGGSSGHQNQSKNKNKNKSKFDAEPTTGPINLLPWRKEEKMALVCKVLESIPRDKERYWTSITNITGKTAAQTQSLFIQVLLPSFLSTGSFIPKSLSSSNNRSTNSSSSSSYNRGPPPGSSASRMISYTQSHRQSKLDSLDTRINRSRESQSLVLGGTSRSRVIEKVLEKVGSGAGVIDWVEVAGCEGLMGRGRSWEQCKFIWGKVLLELKRTGKIV